MFFTLVTLAAFVSLEVQATPTYALSSEENSDIMDDSNLYRYIFQRYGKEDPELIGSRGEKRTSLSDSQDEFMIPQKQDFPHPWSSNTFPLGKRIQETEKRTLIASNKPTFFKRTAAGYGFDHLARMKKANYGFDHLARMKKANYGFDHLARMKKANYGFDHLARMRKATYGFNHLARMKKPFDGNYEFDHLARM